MTVEPAPDLDPDFDAVAARLGCRLIQHERLTGGSSAHVWRLDLSDGDGRTSSVVLRQHRRTGLKDHASSVPIKEYELLQHLHTRGMPVATPLVLDPGQGWLVTSFVAGSPDVAADQLVPMIDQMADFLARLHELDVETLAVSGLGELEDPVLALADHLPNSNAGRILGALLDSESVALHQNPAVLIHGDYWPGNVLWHHDRLAAVIDWEDSCRGDPLADLACSRVELLCMYGQDAVDEFTKRYLAASQNLDLRSLPVWEAYVSATALASMHLWDLEPAAEAAQRATTTGFFEQAVAVLEARA